MRRRPRQLNPPGAALRRPRVAAAALPTSSAGEIRRRDVFPLLVLHLIRTEPSYGNHLIEEITQGVISVNPNTMYPLLCELEANGMIEIEGKWEHPDRRTRRFYEITKAGGRKVAGSNPVATIRSTGPAGGDRAAGGTISALASDAPCSGRTATRAERDIPFEDVPEGASLPPIRR